MYAIELKATTQTFVMTVPILIGKLGLWGHFNKI